MRSELCFNLQDGRSLESKMLEFKEDEDKMYEMNKFIDELLIEAQARQQEAQQVNIFLI